MERGSDDTGMRGYRAAAVGAELRRDAQRNRERIIHAAREVFLTHGVTVAMATVARQAGVGVGTLYRRFPDRDALIRSVADTLFRDLISEASAAYAEEPDAWTALQRVLRRCASPHVGALSAALRPRLLADDFTEFELAQLRHRWHEWLDALVTSAQRAGDLRLDVTSADVIVLLGQLSCHLPEQPDGGDRLSAQLTEIMIDGLHASRSNGGTRISPEV